MDDALLDAIVGFSNALVNRQCGLNVIESESAGASTQTRQHKGIGPRIRLPSSFFHLLSVSHSSHILENEK